jgi:hypothetical protein
VKELACYTQINIYKLKYPKLVISSGVDMYPPINWSKYIALYKGVCVCFYSTMNMQHMVWLKYQFIELCLMNIHILFTNVSMLLL